MIPLKNQVGGVLTIEIQTFNILLLKPTWTQAGPIIFSFEKQNREKGKRGKTKWKRKENLTAKEEEKESEIEV